MDKSFLGGVVLTGLLALMCGNIACSDYEQTIDKLHEDKIEYKAEIEELNMQINQLEAEIVRLNELPQWTSLGTFKVTYYWIGEDEYGDTIARPCDGSHKAIEGHTIAVDPTVIPYGTEVLINGNVYIAEDCGSAVKGNIIDIFVEEPRHERLNANVYVRRQRKWILRFWVKRSS